MIRIKTLAAAAAIAAALSLTACSNADFETTNGADLSTSSTESVAPKPHQEAEPTAAPAKINPLEDQYSSSESNPAGKNYNGITNSDVNLHSDPGGTTIGTVPANTKLEILGKDGNWYKIRYGDQTGYIYGQYMDFFDGTNGLDSDLEDFDLTSDSDDPDDSQDDWLDEDWIDDYDDEDQDEDDDDPNRRPHQGNFGNYDYQGDPDDRDEYDDEEDYEYYDDYDDAEDYDEGREDEED